MAIIIGRRAMILSLALLILIFITASCAAQSDINVEIENDLVRIIKPKDVDAGDMMLTLGITAILLKYNEAAFNLIHDRYDGTAFDTMSPTISGLCDGSTVALATGIIYLNDKETGELALSSLIRTGLTVQIIKILTGYPRPGIDDPPVFHGPRLKHGYDSFPSGHTAAAFTLATVLSKKYPEYREVLYIVAGLVGLSRIMQEAHWPADVFAGAVIGVTMANDTINYGKIIEIHF